MRIPFRVLLEDLSEAERSELMKIKSETIDLHSKFSEEDDSRKKEKINKEIRYKTDKMKQLLAKKRGEEYRSYDRETRRDSEEYRRRAREYGYESTGGLTEDLFDRMDIYFLWIQLGVFITSTLVRILWKIWQRKHCKGLRGKELYRCRINGCERIIKRLNKDLKKIRKKKDVPEKKKQIQTIKNEIKKWRKRKQIYKQKLTEKTRK